MQIQEPRSGSYRGNFDSVKRKLQKSLERTMQKQRHRSIHLLQEQTYPNMQKLLEQHRRKRRWMVKEWPLGYSHQTFSYNYKFFPYCGTKLVTAK